MASSATATNYSSLTQQELFVMMYLGDHKAKDAIEAQQKAWLKQTWEYAQSCYQCGALALNEKLYICVVCGVMPYCGQNCAQMDVSHKKVCRQLSLLATHSLSFDKILSIVNEKIKFVPGVSKWELDSYISVSFADGIYKEGHIAKVPNLFAIANMKSERRDHIREVQMQVGKGACILSVESEKAGQTLFASYKICLLPKVTMDKYREHFPKKEEKKSEASPKKKEAT